MSDAHSDLPFEVAHTWIEPAPPELGYELPSGKVATDLSVGPGGLTLGATESFGENGTPYADTPQTHQEYLESPDVASTEGSVTYTRPAGSGKATLSLPAQIRFEETVPFEAQPETARELVAEIEACLENAVDVDVTVTLPPEVEA